MWLVLYAFKHIYLYGFWENAFWRQDIWLIGHPHLYWKERQSLKGFIESPLCIHILVSFGCLAYIHSNNLPKDKFQARSKICVFWGYPSRKKGRRFYNLDNDKFMLSIDVVFEESCFPFGEITQNRSKPSADFQNFGELPITNSVCLISNIFLTHLHLDRSSCGPDFSPIAGLYRMPSMAADGVVSISLPIGKQAVPYGPGEEAASSALVAHTSLAKDQDAA